MLAIFQVKKRPWKEKVGHLTTVLLPPCAAAPAGSACAWDPRPSTRGAVGAGVEIGCRFPN
jgi:hypothetical protein